MMLTIAGIASLAAVFNAIFPAITRSSGAIVTSSANIDERLRSDIEIIHAVGELNSSGAFADSSPANGFFEVFVWVKNVGDTRITSIENTDIFFGQVGNFSRIPNIVEVQAGVYPRWSYIIEGSSDDSQLNPKDTLKITIDFETDTQSAGSYDVKITVPNGVTDNHFFSM